MARRRKAADMPAAATANPPQVIPAGSMKVDFAAMMPGYPARHDGWNQPRLQRFLDTLSHTGCVEDAARVAGMSAVAARRAQRRFPRFAAAWEDALERSRQGLIAIAYQRAVEGRETVIIRKGEEYERRIQPSDSMLGLLIKRGDMLGEKRAHSPDEVLTQEEYLAGWAFNKYGQKFQHRPDDEVMESLMKKLSVLRKRMFADAYKRGVCMHCEAPLPPGTTNSMLDARELG